ncbi:MAG: hypothetical protein MUO53_02720 [Maribacter sp.]|nr:hypothetical protein [Maribacter sp.]
MKYQIKVEGGFTGITKEYNGEMHFSPDERKAILKLLQNPVKSKNTGLRDGFVYSFMLRDGTSSYTAHFDEANLPITLRNVLARISKKS